MVKNKKYFVIYLSIILLALVFVSLIALLIFNNPRSQTTLRLEKAFASTDPNVYKKAAVELQKLVNNQQFNHLPKDPYNLFHSLVRPDVDFWYVVNASSIISRLPRSEKIISLTQSILSEDNDTNINAIVASLMYSDKHDIQTLNNYFLDKDYSSINPKIRANFDHTIVVSSIRDKYIPKLVNSYINWKAPESEPKTKNPYIDEIVDLGRFVTEELMKSQEGKEILDDAVVIALGAIGSITNCPILYQEYIQHPSQKLAIAVGCTWNSGYIEKAFNEDFKDKKLLSAFLAPIYGNRWTQVQDKTIEEIKKDLLTNFTEITINCQKRIIMMN